MAICRRVVQETNDDLQEAWTPGYEREVCVRELGWQMEETGEEGLAHIDSPWAELVETERLDVSFSVLRTRADGVAVLKSLVHTGQHRARTLIEVADGATERSEQAPLILSLHVTTLWSDELCGV